MPGASRRFRAGSAVVWCATLAGALLGVTMTRPRAGACECSPPEWRLTLNSDATNSEDVDAWPAIVHLEARPETVVLWSEDFTTETIDHLHAGDP
jgi:hypothetical protein